MKKEKVIRHSECGFYCGDCDKFVYDGYDHRDKLNLPDNSAGTDCGKKYKDKSINQDVT